MRIQMNPPPKKPKPPRSQPMIFLTSHRNQMDAPICWQGSVHIQLMTAASLLYGCLSIPAIKKKKTGACPPHI